MIVTEDEVQRIYRRRFGEAEKKAKADVWKVIVESFFQKWIRPTDVVLDLGCGYGEFLNFLHAQRRIGVDLNPDSQSHLAQGIEFHKGSVCDLSFLPDNSVDVVFTSNLMEHLPGKREVEQMSREALRVLKPGGHFIMMGPNLRLLPGTYWDFWDHVVPITDRSLVECLENLNFNIADCFSHFLPYTTRSSLPQSPWLVRLYLALPSAWRFLGKQFLIRAQKPIPPLTSIVLPVYNEAQNIAPCLTKLESALQHHPHEILVCYDFDEDSTLPAIVAMPVPSPNVRLVKNTLGRGVAFALQAGFNAAQGDVVVSTMADLSDPPEVIPAMIEKIRRGADVVSGSRYMKGGSQHGGPFLKRTLSRLAGLSLRHVAGINTHDATTNFRAYSSQFLRSHPIESTAGFEVALELTTKAQRDGARIDEVPSSWQDRTAGESRFNLKKWLPKYLYWYGRAIAPSTIVWGALIAMLIAWGILIAHYGASGPMQDELHYVSYFTGEQPLTLQSLWVPHNDHRIPIPKLVLTVLVRISNYRQQAAMGTSVALLGIASLALLLAIRRARGFLRWTDASIPICVLCLAQYEDVLWAFQICFAISTALVLGCLAAGILFKRKKAFPLILFIGLAAMAMPLCGGEGMIMAAPYALWLIGLGSLWTFRRADPSKRGLGILALLLGIFALAIWAAVARGLPPGEGTAPLFAAFTSMANFIGFVHMVLRATQELLSTTFIPIGHSTASFYSWANWGLVGIALLIADFSILMTAWFYRKNDRLQISAISATFWAYALLCLGMAATRGVMGPNSCNISRYAMIAAPLLPLSIVCFSLYTSKGIRTFIPAALMIAILALIPGPSGNFSQLREYGAPRVAAYKQLTRDIRQSNGAAPLEVLTARYASPILCPCGDAAQFPEYMEIMARHKVGPYRNTSLPPTHIDQWTAKPIPFQLGDTQWAMQWITPTHGIGLNASSCFTIHLEHPQYIAALRITMSIHSMPANSFFVTQFQPQLGEKQQTTLFSKGAWVFLPDHPTPITRDLYVFGTIDQIKFWPTNLANGDVEIQKIEALTPVADSAPPTTSNP